MNYELNSTYNTTNNNGMNTGNDYFHSHHYHHHTKSNSNGFHNSSKTNNHNRFDDNDDEQKPIDDTDRPKLLMWGLTKYKIRLKNFIYIYIYLLNSRSGKTSIIKLIFEKMTAGETLKLPETKIVQIHGKNFFFFLVRSFNKYLFFSRTYLWYSCTISNS